MRGQRGFTLIEILMAVAITGMIMPVVASAIYLISRGTVRMNNDFVIQQDIDSASNWFNRDLSQAQTIDLADGAPSVNHVRVDWNDLTGWATEGAEGHYAVYTLSGTNLMRNYDGGTPSIAARRVANIQFSRSGRFITVTITSSLRGQAETLTYFITPRTDGALQ